MITVFVDGGARPNPGKGAYAYTIDGEGMHYQCFAPCGDKVTNNQCEYIAICEAMKTLIELNLTEHNITIFTDSQLLVGQLQGSWKSNSLLPYYPHYQTAKLLIKQFSGLTLRKTSREKNSQADNLVEEALDTEEVAEETKAKTTHS